MSIWVLGTVCPKIYPQIVVVEVVLVVCSQERLWKFLELSLVGMSGLAAGAAEDVALYSFQIGVHDDKISLWFSGITPKWCLES